MFSLNFLRNTLISSNIARTSLLSASVRACSNQEEVRVPYREITKDRTKVIPVETSIKYIRSAAYKQTYGEKPVWVPYKRNHKGALPPKKTRKTCIRGGQISTGSPCPVCRDEYLVLHEENIDLLKQFICPHTGSVLSYSKTGLCQKKHLALLVAIDRAKDKGLLTFDVPFRTYDYSEYHKPTSI